LCELLCKLNSKVNKLDSFSMTALHWASSLNLLPIIEVLFKYDANPNVLDLKNQTPIDKAIQNGNVKIVKLFAQHFSLQYRFREYLMASIKNTNIEIFE
jgi:ankyrin repeat protein